MAMASTPPGSQMLGRPRVSFESLCVYTGFKEVTQWKVFLRLFSDQMGHRLLKKESKPLLRFVT